MAKRAKKGKKIMDFSQLFSWFDKLSLSPQIRRYITGVLFFLTAIILIFSFFKKAAIAGRAIYESLSFLIGKELMGLRENDHQCKQSETSNVFLIVIVCVRRKVYIV